MTGGEFIAFARKLLTLPAARCAAGYRSITSRLYYGAYHEALAFIEDELGFRHRKMDDNVNKHQFVVVCREDDVRSRIQRGMSEYRQGRSSRP